MDNDFFLFRAFDAAELVLWVFWLFFAGLIVYLRKENRREGFPLENDVTGRLEPLGTFLNPKPKTFRLPHGHGTRTVPDSKRDTRPLAAVRSAATDGSPIEPTGNPLADGVGPAAWADRPNYPDMTLHGLPRLVPLRADPTYHLAAEDPDPRGFSVVGCDGQVAGTVTDVWADRSEFIARYHEMTVAATGRTALIPVNQCVVKGGKRIVEVGALTAAQFAGIPGLAQPETITLNEEERVMAYYGGGYLYATPDRQEPWL